MIKTILFDMDGLLFDTENLVSRAWLHVGKTYGYPITMELLNQMRGLQLKDCRKKFVEALGEGFDYDAVRVKRVAYVEEEIQKNGVPVKKGARELLEWLKEHGYPAVLATSTHRKTAMDYLEKSGLAPYFAHLVFGDMVAYGKPHPDTFLRAAREAGAHPEDCLVLEDSYAGVEAGFRAGCKVIMVPDLLPMTPREEPMVCACCESLLEVIEVISGKGGLL